MDNEFHLINFAVTININTKPKSKFFIIIALTGETIFPEESGRFLFLRWKQCQSHLIIQCSTENEHSKVKIWSTFA